ncbi:MAG: trehalose-phosphatase [Nitrospirota bacterium]
MKKQGSVSRPYYFFNKNYFYKFLRPDQKIALFLDYDGTLVPIQKNPAQCILSDKLRNQLQLLADSNRCYLTILSGRSLSDIRKMVRIKKIYYGGNHGLDISGPDVRYTHPKAIFAKPIMNCIRQHLQKKIVNIEGAWLEDKKFTVSLHFRSVKKKDILSTKKEFYRIVTQFSENKSLSILKGKKVLELVPDTSWNKGVAALWILQRLKDKCLPIYIGDDWTDETAFKTLRTRGVTIRIGKSKKTSANYYLKGYREVSRLLQQIQEITKTL